MLLKFMENEMTNQDEKKPSEYYGKVNIYKESSKNEARDEIRDFSFGADDIKTAQEVFVNQVEQHIDFLEKYPHPFYNTLVFNFAVSKDFIFSYFPVIDQAKYKGYVAKFSVDFRDNIIVGRVINSKALISFHGDSVKEVLKAFHDSIDNYLETCKEENIEPSIIK